VSLWALAWFACYFGFWWLSLILAVPAAGFLVRLFMIQHDCGHGAIAAIDLCVVPTLTFECAYLRFSCWATVDDSCSGSRHPTAEWLAQQIVEAFPWGRPIWCATMMAPMGGHSPIASGRWGFATTRFHRGRPGRIHMLSA
jgi:hypothetical protein